MTSQWDPDYWGLTSSAPSATLNPQAAASRTAKPSYATAYASYDNDSLPVTPDVVANPWNTSLLWSAGIVDNRDPRSNFWPIANWRNFSIPSNIDTAPIQYYYSSSNEGDSVNFVFTGHGLSVLDYRGPSRGEYNLTIDNTTTVVINAYSANDELAAATGSQLPPVIWTSDTLDEGTHSVVMSNMNNQTHMHFWGIVINPNNYVPGKSFLHIASNVKTIIIASTVTASVMLLLFAIAASLFYYCKLVRPRRRLQSQMDAERKDLSLLPHSISSSSTANSSSRSQLRLDTAFLSSQGDLGRVPSRVTATTNESQYWLQPDIHHSLTADTSTRPSNRVHALFQEVTPISPTLSSPSSPTANTPATELDSSATAYSTSFGCEPVSPISPSNAYATAQSPTQHRNFWDASHQYSVAARPNHARGASTSDVDPFQDAHSVSLSPTSLTRSASRRPLPTPPTSMTPVSPVTLPLPPAVPPRPNQTIGTAHIPTSPATSSLGPAVPPRPTSSAERESSRYRVEQDACSIHFSDNGLFDDHTGETLLPPPYAPRDMGRHFT
ncbi:hypothetical protein PANT_20d00023 [Moesziomyces antarcticus T-34]|uniref:Transmembrane protein n=1 Tax=Pseudozyma antarctica (strain T-34) TaxID=1151754 RepID=M9LS52_PSEA3|nr:hypothetical protein PANT_20d00023 [Moesziomyces antarcticus T-34]